MDADEIRVGAEAALYGTLVIAYLFLGGAAGGAYFVMAAWSLIFHRRDAEHPHRLRIAFKALLKRVYIVSLLTLIVAAACLVSDLNLPGRALLMFSRPHPTLLTFGAYALAAQAVVGLALGLANAFDLKIIGGHVRKALEATILALSLCVMLYTGLFLASNASIPFWNTPWLAVLFLLSSISSGVSAVLLIDYFTQGQTLLLRAAKPLQKAHLACLALEAATLTGFLRAGFSNPDAAKCISLLMEPEMLSIGLVGVVIFGIVLPFLLEGYALTRKECRTIPFSDVICLIGSFCLRWCVIMCGVH